MKNVMKNNFPVDWKQIPVSEVFKFLRTYAISRDNLKNGIAEENTIGNIHYGDIHATYTTPSVDVRKQPIPLAKDVNFTVKDEDLLQDGDLIMADASEDYEGVGSAVAITGIGNKKIVGGLHTFVLRDRDNGLLKKFTQYIFRNPEIRNKLRKIANGVSVYGISKNSLSAITLYLPTLPEQNRIVAVLETWDRAIEKLTKKIEIKKSIKKGLMQQLLTGRVRLPEFKKNWIKIKIGDLGSYYSGISGKSKDDFGHGKPFISYMNVYSNSKINTAIKDFVNITDGEDQNKVKYGDLFFTTSSETPDEVGISSVLLDKNIEELYLNSFCFGFRLNNFETIIPEFCRYYFRSDSFRKSMFEIAQGASRFNLSKKYFLGIYIRVPEDLCEQKTIFEILNTADREINFLQSKLSSLKDQKKYLLNNLITGAIRTPEDLKMNLDPRVKPEDDSADVQDDKVAGLETTKPAEDEAKSIIRSGAKESTC